LETPFNIPQASDGQKFHARLLHRTADDFSEELRRSFAHMWCENSKLARSAVKQRKCVGPDRKAISAIQGPLKAVRKKPSPHKMMFLRGSDTPSRLLPGGDVQLLPETTLVVRSKRGSFSFSSPSRPPLARQLPRRSAMDTARVCLGLPELEG